MEIKSAEFIISNTDYHKCPAPTLPEYAFIGRSNVGKSSLINMLVNHKSLANTSARPGKTQLINHYLINKAWYLVDLPGYGYAKASKNQRERWNKHTQKYFVNRPNLECIFLLIDSRIEPQQIDIEFADWLVHSDLPFVLVYTKSDKSGNYVQQTLQAFKNKVKETWDDFPQVIVTSAETKRGRDELLDLIAELNREFVKPPKE